LAGELFDEALPGVMELTTPRAWAFALLGLHEYLRRLGGDRLAHQTRDGLMFRLMALFEKYEGEGWFWCEELVTYDNARLAQALILSGEAAGEPSVVEQGLRALRWLAELQTSEDGHFRPVGCHGFYRRGGLRAKFDQQPIEACAMVSAGLDAYQLTGDAHWHDEACRAFDWFLGWNDLGLELYSPSSGGCHDGLQVDRVNRNQGAESTLSFALALAEMKLAQNAAALNQFAPLVDHATRRQIVAAAQI